MKWFQILILAFLLYSPVLLQLYFPTFIAVYAEPSTPKEIHKNQSINLSNATRILVPPSHGSLTKYNITTHAFALKYTPFNYSGIDSFTFENSSKERNQVSIIIHPIGSKLLYVAPPEQRAGLAFVLSLIIVFLIFLIAYLIIRKTRVKKYKARFWDIVRDQNWYPSLAIFQFLLWTGVVLFAYFGVYLTRLISGGGGDVGIPQNLFAVMGISAGVTVVNGYVSQFKYGDTTPSNIESTKEVPLDKIRKLLPGFKTMIMENNKITLPRFQMFAWTWIGIISYLAILFSGVYRNVGWLEQLALPELPIVFVSLMGLSQVTYQAVKAITPAIFSIYEVRPRKIELQNENNLVTILGSNFGTSGTVWIEHYRPLTDNDKQEIGYNTLADEEKEEICYNAMYLEQQIKLDPEIPREDNRIVVKLDNIKDKLKPQNYLVRVEKNGILSYATSDAVFDIIETARK